MKAMRLTLPRTRSEETARAATEAESGRRPRLFEYLAGATSARSDQYVRLVLQSLAVFRFLSFALGVSIEFTVRGQQETVTGRVVLVIIVGFYNFIRVIFPFNPSGRHPVVQSLALITDAVLGIVLVMGTDGLESGFLIYSLAPILAVSLLMDVWTATALAVINALSIVGAYTFSKAGVGDFPWILDENFLVFALLYGAVCLLAAALPFLANLNWQRRVRAESMDAERIRLRREVHDNVAQTLAFLNLKIRRAEEKASGGKVAMTPKEVADIAQAVERAYLAVRDYLDDTRDPTTLIVPFGTGLRAAVSQWSHDTDLAAQVAIIGSDTILPPRVHRQLLQIAGEALANVAKHASPDHVWVSWEWTGQGGVLRIRDDGRGFAEGQARGHGSSIMQERAALIGATVAIASKPGLGTEVTVTWSRLDGEDKHE